MATDTKKIVLSNIVENKALKQVQKDTLKIISDVVSKTAGPYGSYTMIMQPNVLTKYTKDGHKVLEAIKFHKPLEQAIHDELLDITEYVVKKVGDGTTTAVQLAYLIYSEMSSMSAAWDDDGISAYQIMQAFESVVHDLEEKIRKRTVPFSPEMAEDICMISTNGNEIISKDIADIYKKFGNDVYIQVGTSNTESSVLKVYDGCILNKGFASPAFINTDNNTCEIYNPHFYYFKDQVDTPEMIQLFMSIFADNIYTPYSKHQPHNYVPTVILCPSISQDMISELQDIDKIFYAYDNNRQRKNKPPFCIVTDINSNDNIGDITTLCRCPIIKKYINPDQREADIKAGNAPSAATVTEFYGTADLVTIDIDKMKIVNPADMFDTNAETAEDGSRPFSGTYNGLVNYLRSQIKIEEEAKSDLNVIIKLRKRLHALTANFVEYLVGGVAEADRGNLKDLVDDAVLNCRSAAVNGVGQASGIEGILAANEYNLYMQKQLDKSDDKDVILKSDIISIIYSAYNAMIINLYTTKMSRDKAENILANIINNSKTAYNLRDDRPVIGSIETDIVILEAISKIITTLFNSNQVLLADPLQNAYIDIDGDNK